MPRHLGSLGDRAEGLGSLALGGKGVDPRPLPPWRGMGVFHVHWHHLVLT